jgi:hypothetical protein
MNRFFNYSTLISSSFLISSALAYVVQKGDSLSTIAYKNISPKVYGKNGSLKKLLSLNTQLKNTSLILPGSYIQLPQKEKNLSERVPRTPAVSNSQEREPGLSELIFSPTYSLTTLSARDNKTQGKSVIASKLNVGLEVSYDQKWSEEFQTGLYLKMGSITFEQPSSSTKSLENSSVFTSAIGIKTKHQINENLRYQLMAQYGKELFIRSSSSQKVSVDAINLPTIGGKFSYDLKKISSQVMGISGTYQLKLPSRAESYDVKLGHDIGAGLYLSEKHFQTEIGVSYRKQDTNLTTQSEFNVFIGFHFPMGVK